MSPRRLYAALARAEAVTWALLLLGMALKYLVVGTEVGVRLAGPVHGFVFLAYALTTVLVGVDGRWGVRRVAVGLLSAVVPFASVPFERRTDRAGLLGERWRLRHEAGGTALERVVGTAVRAPLVAGAVAVVVLALVFSGLLLAGPPTQWAG